VSEVRAKSKDMNLAGRNFVILLEKGKGETLQRPHRGMMNLRRISVRLGLMAARGGEMDVSLLLSLSHFAFKSRAAHRPFN
jgi:hypothetical protein